MEIVGEGVFVSSKCVGSNVRVGITVGDAWQATRLMQSNKLPSIKRRPLRFIFNMNNLIIKNRLKFAPLKYLE